VLTPAGFNCAPTSLGWTASNYSSITDEFFNAGLAKAVSAVRERERGGAGP
jgi:hypothetical protein